MDVKARAGDGCKGTVTQMSHCIFILLLRGGEGFQLNITLFFIVFELL